MLPQTNFLHKNQPKQQRSMDNSSNAFQTMDFDEFLETLFPHKDLNQKDKSDVVNKLKNDPSAFSQAELLKRRAEYALNKSGYLFEAFVCAELLDDMELAIKTLQLAKEKEGSGIGLR